MRNNPREQLLNLHRHHVKAWEQKSFDHLRDLYNDDAVIFNIVPPPRFSDFKTFENTLNQYFTQIKEVSILTSNIQIEVQGNVSWVTSQYLMAYNLNGQLIRQNGRWTEIYFLTNGEWKLSHLHASPDPLEQPSSETPKSKRKSGIKKPKPRKKIKTKRMVKKKLKTKKQTKKKISKKKPARETPKKRTTKKRSDKKTPKKKTAIRIAKKRIVKKKVVKKTSTRKETVSKAIKKRPARKKSVKKPSKKSPAKRIPAKRTRKKK